METQNDGPRSQGRHGPIRSILGLGGHDSPLSTPFPMPLTLGYLPDLLWICVPEARPIIATWLCGEIVEAADVGRVLTPPSPGVTAVDLLWYPLMEPALNEKPIDQLKVARYFAVVRESYAAEGTEREQVRQGLIDYVLEFLADPRYREIVRTIDPGLFRILNQAVPHLMD